MTERTVYLVSGASGEYEDRAQWPVRAFESEADAQAFVAAVQADERRIYTAYRDAINAWRDADYDGPTPAPDDSELDPGMTFTGYGASYAYEAIPLGALELMTKYMQRALEEATDAK